MKIKKVAVNTRVLMPNKLDGIGWFTYQVLKRWVENNKDVQFFFLFDRPYDASFLFGDNVTPIVVSPPARHPLLWYIWYEWRLPAVLNKLNPDVFISLDTYTSTRWKGRKITGIHDIAFALFDGQLDILTEKFYRYFIPKYISVSDKVVTVSNSTKQDLINFYHCPSSKIIVSNNAAAEVYRPLSLADKKKFKSENTQDCDYFIFVGSIHPRKNVLSLLKAFESYKRNNKNEVKLVLIGRLWRYEDVTDYLKIMSFKNEVIQIPHSPPETIAQWVACALSLVMVSIYEGFGVPIVEAMACGVPVICSNVSSMPEVAGDAAILVPPEDVAAIERALHQMESDTQYREKLASKAIVQAANYSWDRAADVIWKEINPS